MPKIILLKTTKVNGSFIEGGSILQIDIDIKNEDAKSLKNQGIAKDVVSAEQMAEFEVNKDKQVEELAAENEALNKQLEALKIENDELRKQLEALKIENDELRKQLEALAAVKTQAKK